ncbi:hypothetical protein [Paracraurococcus lichenis]|uniref:Uncharacterized protein n=1 Tax=Paracraurococcus lichenis TaxID=3064888 RepID=A0ABT9DZ52_9PROT|nr:hypothetical protein [Paracraurococcus sp. LOR1-02]MDO9709183.1 hypothetical protein [Paracraurococcus sp. LOR1-02]
MSQIPLQRRQARAVAVPVRHAASAGLVAAAAAFPSLAVIPVVPEGEPFLLVAAIGLALWLFGRAAAMSASVLAIGLGAWLLPAEGAGAQAMLPLLPLPMVALGMAGAGRSFADIFRLMERADARRSAEARAAAPPEG